MRFCVLGSGSKGNSTFVEVGNTRLLIDAGFSGVEIERRLATLEIAPETISAILVTHEHGDHVRGVQVLSRRFKLPVMVSRSTRGAAGSAMAKIHHWQEISAGCPLKFQELTIHPFSVSHDAADPLGYVIGGRGLSFGYCTDTGVASRLMLHRLGGCNGLVLECNHDPEMLKNGGYPPHLQQRIRSKSGHLANSDAARFLIELIHDGLEHVVLAHLSETNNTPDLARSTVERHLQGYDLTTEESRRFKVSLACQDSAGEMVRLRRGRGS